uniref:Uncharacterized protein n=1 Tax=Anguilla anguilla TaxID=7936 RepID=A0A0E9PYD3_ANGAN
MSVIGIWTCRPLDCSMERGTGAWSKTTDSSAPCPEPSMFIHKS